MKETKVYMELPNGANEETCDECPYAELGEVQHYFINNEIISCRDCICKLDKTCGFRHGEKHCPLIDIKAHDRELVRQVCEKIKYKLGSIEDILINLGNGKEDALNYFTHILNEIEKEFEK